MPVGRASVLGIRPIKRSITRKIQYWDTKKPCITSMCQYLQTGNFDEIGVTEKKRK